MPNRTVVPSGTGFPRPRLKTSELQKRLSYHAGNILKYDIICLDRTWGESHLLEIDNPCKSVTPNRGLAGTSDRLLPVAASGHRPPYLVERLHYFRERGIVLVHTKQPRRLRMESFRGAE
jgi:hypothetical protein